jgi:multiple sugar transport system permease protein
MKRKAVITRILPHLPLVVLGLFFLFPFLWMLSTALKTLPEATALPLKLLPRPPHWENFSLAFQRVPYLRYAMNTIFLTTVSVIAYLISSPLVAYSVSKINWVGKKILFPLILATMLLPMQVTMVPLFMVFNKLGWVGSFKPLIVPAFMGGAFYIFLLRQFFLTIPDSLFESARIDGAQEWRIYFKIALPLCKPALTTVAIFAFLSVWSDFLGPLIYLTKQEMYTLSIGLQSYKFEHYIEWNLLMAAAAMFTVPIIVLYFFAQRKFIEGIATTGLKG